MTPVLVVIVAGVVVVAAVMWVLARRSRHADGVDSFRRQIDALSPQARRSTVEQLHVESVKPQPSSPKPESAPVEPDPERDGSDDRDDPDGEGSRGA
ncbi:MAG TPA: hypothetical protein VNQ73_18675 [Ilumatobacter sp.]|nr:hypothetical protein [Ilumatobacter sp.]